MKNDFLIVIPARLSSTRLPNKPLLDICGKNMLHRTYDRCASVFSKKIIYVATENELIIDYCKLNSINVQLTSQNCLTGTDRVAEFSKFHSAKYYINVQGDEPLINPEDILKVVNSINFNRDEILNCYTSIYDEKQFRNNTIPKVVFRPDGRLLYMSRSYIPGNKADKFNKAWRQVCIYAFPFKLLQEFATVKIKTELEFEEDIEILRFLEMGYEVRMLEVSGASISVDTKDDLKLVRGIINSTK